MKVMKLIQKLRSARQRFPRLADSTFGVIVEASSLVSLSWCVLRMVAAQEIESTFTKHKLLWQSCADYTMHAVQ